MSRQENRNCQNCNKDFIIEDEDFNFYEKIKVPPPTFCPECRLQRRLAWRNERILYRRKCDAKGHDDFVITVYSPNTKIKVFDSKNWNSDIWNGLDYGNDFDFSKTFFEQWSKLFFSVPAQQLFNVNAVNSDYCNCTFQTKNSYLNFASDMNEDTGYLYHSIENRNCFDMLGARKNENCYQLIDCERCYNCANLQLAEDCINCNYCFDCRNCQNCIGCFGLRNDKFCIYNKQFSQEEYEKEIRKLELDSADNNKKIKEKFFELLLYYPRKFSSSRHSVNSTGDYLNHVKNIKNCFDIEGPAEDLKYTIYGLVNIKNVYDSYAIGLNVENYYEVLGGGDKVANSIFSFYIVGSYNIFYSYQLRSCSDCFACVGLRSKSYCILNKQYTKEQYEELVPKIIKHMNDMPYIDSKGRVYKYGEFFPSELSPFCYNETIAQEYFPLTKKEALEQCYNWKDKEERNYQIDIKNEDIPDHINDIDESIIGKVIECGHKGECNEQCTEAFKIIESEYQFYKRMNLPLPRFCPNCRHYQRLKQRNPLKLWHRQCMCDKENHNHEGRCEVEFETSYSPERPEIVYCEHCYQQEIY